jgi:hypothetical protein
MTAQMEFVSKGFDQVFENFRKATESTLQMQQDLVRQWTSFWPAFPKPIPPMAEQFQTFQKEWNQTTAELTRKYLATWERQYKEGVESLEKACQLATAKDSAEFRQKVLELWQKSFDCLKELAQAQTHNFQAAIEKWIELGKKANSEK